MYRYPHEDDWTRPIRKPGGRLYEGPVRRVPRDDPPPPSPLSKTWEARAHERSRLDAFEQELALQRQRLAALEARETSCTIEIHTFAPEPYRAKKPIPITVRPHQGEFLASFVDANVNATGDTGQEAFQALKALLLDMLDHLSRQPKLGPKLMAKLAVLREFIDGP